MHATIPIRCDSGLIMGSGHVMRCRTLARQLRRHDVDVLFLCRQQPGDLIQLLADEFAVRTLPSLPASASGAAQPTEPASWLGCTQDQDAADTLAAIAAVAPASIPWIVADHYGVAAPWHLRVVGDLRRQGHQARLLVIDDLADRDLAADLLVDQNWLRSDGLQLYKQRVPKSCRCLLGPHYALIGDEFAMLHKILPSRIAPLQKLLIFFGGADHGNISELCLRALLEPSPLPIKIDVVLGPSNIHRQRLEHLTRAHPQVRLHGPQPSLVGLIAQADLAIGAGGVTSWERACLGLPALMSSLASNQDAVIQQLSQAGAAVDLGPAAQLSAKTVRGTVQQLLNGTLDLQALSSRARTITDGLGTRRVVAAMLGPRLPISVRKAEAADEAIWLHWANDSESRAASFSHDPISPQQHHLWFSTRLMDPATQLLIAHTADGLPLGSVRFEQISGGAHGTQWLVSLALEPACRGHGLAASMLMEAIATLRQYSDGCGELVAEVKPSNLASISLFEKAGFKACAPRRSKALCFQRTII